MLKEIIYSEDIEYKASSSLESRRIPDYFTYLIKNGELYSPVTKRPVKESITTRTLVEEVELQAFIEIEDWAANSIYGTSVWVSPPVREDLSAKAIISEIQNDIDYGKVLVNRNICFEWDPELFLNFAHSAGHYGIITGEDFRRIPMFFLPENSREIYELLDKIEPIQIEMVKSGEDIAIKEDLKRSMAGGQSAPMGTSPLSCDGAFGLLYRNSLELKFIRNCGNQRCRMPINKYMKKNDRCPHCNGIYEGC